jgi:polyisoprenoid-binding protein YceI
MTRKPLLAVVALLAAAPAFPGEVFVVDKTHSNVLFTVRHFVSRVTGRFDDYTVKVDLDRARPESSSVEFAIKAASINTDNPDRDKHLRSADFFDVEKHPEITFKSTKVEATGKDTYQVVGNLTMRGVTKEVPVQVTFLGFLKDPRGNERAGFEVTTTLNRKDFGIVWNRALDSGGFMLSDDVKVTINLEMIKQQEPAATK